MKKYLFTSLLIGAVLAPALASAQTASTTVNATTTATTSLAFTLCQQAAIEKRDTSLGTARTAYNTSMAQALTVRKDAEKAAVAITDPTAKVAAVKLAAETYRKSVTAAQDALTSNRKVVLATFETDAKECRSTKQDTRKAIVTEKKAEIKTLQAEHKAQVEVKKAEIKTLRESFRTQLDALRALFTRKPAASVNVNASTTVSQ